MNAKSVYPNLFSARNNPAKITFSNLPPNAIIGIYDHKGELVHEIPCDNMDSSGKVRWDASKIASGIYYYVIESQYIKKMGKIIINEDEEQKDSSNKFWDFLNISKKRDVRISEDSDKEFLYVKVFPNPFYISKHKSAKIIFHNLPPHTKIRIFNSSKKVVKTMIFHKKYFGYKAEWNVSKLPIGKYYYVLESLYGKKVGKISIKKYAPPIKKMQEMVHKQKEKEITETEKEVEIETKKEVKRDVKKQKEKIEKDKITIIEEIGRIEQTVEIEDKREIRKMKEIEKFAEIQEKTNPESKILYTKVYPNPCVLKKDKPTTITFFSLPARAVVKVYTSTGGLIKVITHNTPKQGLSRKWELSGVESGLYVYKINSPYGEIEGDLVIKD